MNYGKFSSAKPDGSIVRGYWWKLKIWGNLLFELWTPYSVTRKEAKTALMNMASFYENEDITRIWKTKG